MIAFALLVSGRLILSFFRSPVEDEPTRLELDLTLEPRAERDANKRSSQGESEWLLCATLAFSAHGPPLASLGSGQPASQSVGRSVGQQRGSAAASRVVRLKICKRAKVHYLLCARELGNSQASPAGSSILAAISITTRDDRRPPPSPRERILAAKAGRWPPTGWLAANGAQQHHFAAAVRSAACEKPAHNNRRAAGAAAASERAKEAKSERTFASDQKLCQFTIAQMLYNGCCAVRSRRLFGRANRGARTQSRR